MENTSDISDSSTDTPANGSTQSGQQETVAFPPCPAQKKDTTPLFVLLSGAGTGLIITLIIVVIAQPLRQVFQIIMPGQHIKAVAPDSAFIPKIRKIQRKINSLQARVDKLTPDKPYLVISTSDNVFCLMQGGVLLRKGRCSTGSYTLLKSHDNNQQWIFVTPKGYHHIQNKLESPVWRMPDWAFVEDGKPVPAPDAPERYEKGVLGDYALSMGDGYLLHGTLYQRFLGLPVTHGCVRLGDDDLKAIYETLQTGSEVFIY
jgi:hypothetical protein